MNVLCGNSQHLSGNMSLELVADILAVVDPLKIDELHDIDGSLCRFTNAVTKRSYGQYPATVRQ